MSDVQSVIDLLDRCKLEYRIAPPGKRYLYISEILDALGVDPSYLED